MNLACLGTCNASKDKLGWRTSNAWSCVRLWEADGACGGMCSSNLVVSQDTKGYGRHMQWESQWDNSCTSYEGSSYVGDVSNSKAGAKMASYLVLGGLTHSNSPSSARSATNCVPKCTLAATATPRRRILHLL